MKFQNDTIYNHSEENEIWGYKVSKTQNLYVKNYKMLMNKIKHLINGDIWYSWIERLNTVKISVLQHSDLYV